MRHAYTIQSSSRGSQDVSDEGQHTTHQLTGLFYRAYLHPCYGGIGISSFDKVVFESRL